MAPGPTSRRAPGRERFIAGDPLRGLAALGVLVFHVALVGPVVARDDGGHYFPGIGEYGDRVLSHLNIGVHVFFVLSGYLLARPFVAAYVDERPFPVVARYLRNRALRILPALAAAWLVTLAVFGTRDSAPVELLAAPLLVQYVPSAFGDMIGMTWTLSVELGFYLLLPVGFGLLVALLGLPGRRARVLLACGGAAVVAGTSLALLSGVGAQDLDRQHWLPMSLYAFVPGTLLAIVELAAAHRLRSAPRLGRHLARALALGGVALLVALISLRDLSSGRYGLLAAAASGMIVAGPLVRQWADGTCARVLDNRPLHWLGRRSYSLYLFHFAILGLIAQRVTTGGLPSSFVVLLLVGLPASLAAAWAGFALIERPFMAWRLPWRTGRDPVETGAREPRSAPKIAGEPAPGSQIA